MADNQDVTKQVREMYTKYPFPNIDYRMDYGLAILRFLSKLQDTKPGFWQTAKVMEAGCGTGNTLNHLAKIFQKASFLGVDLTPASLQKAEQQKKKMGLTNINFMEGNLLELDLKDKDFDIILCIGVLHHTADMKKSILRLKEHLAEDGILLLWLYGKYGRFRLNLNQRLFSILFDKVTDLQERVDIASEILTSVDKEYVKCHFNVPFSEIENDWGKSLDFIQAEPQWLVDQFLHVNEKVVNMDDILALTEYAGLKLTHWLNVKGHLNDYADSNKAGELFDKLDRKEKLIVIDLLIKPDYYTVILEK